MGSRREEERDRSEYIICQAADGANRYGENSLEGHGSLLGLNVVGLERAAPV
jgi:hypothetical protein